MRAGSPETGLGRKTDLDPFSGKGVTVMEKGETQTNSHGSS